MKTVIKTLFCISLLIFLFGNDSFAQGNKKISFIIKGGLNISNITGFDDHYAYYGTGKVGFNIGGIAEIPIGRFLYIQSGLQLSLKGSKIEDINITEYDRFDYVDATMHAYYLQIPAYVAYKYHFDRWNNSLSISAGPYFAYGIGGKTSFSRSSIGDINTFGNNGLWNRPDLGLGIEASFGLGQHLIFFAGCEFGLTNAIKSSKTEGFLYFNDKMDTKNSNVYFSIGYRF